MRADAAHKAVATKLKNMNIKPARGPIAKSITPRTIRGWSEAIRTYVGRHSEAADL